MVVECFKGVPVLQDSSLREWGNHLQAGSVHFSIPSASNELPLSFPAWCHPTSRVLALYAHLQPILGHGKAGCAHFEGPPRRADTIHLHGIAIGRGVNAAKGL